MRRRDDIVHSEPINYKSTQHIPQSKYRSGSSISRSPGPRIVKRIESPAIHSIEKQPLALPLLRLQISIILESFCSLSIYFNYFPRNLIYLCLTPNPPSAIIPINLIYS